MGEAGRSDTTGQKFRCARVRFAPVKAGFDRTLRSTYMAAFTGKILGGFWVSPGSVERATFVFRTSSDAHRFRILTRATTGALTTTNVLPRFCAMLASGQRSFESLNGWKIGVRGVKFSGTENRLRLQMRRQRFCE